MSVNRDKIKPEIIAEYLNGKKSLRELGRKYGVPYSCIHRWVMNYKKSTQTDATKPEELPQDTRELREALRKSELRNKLLNSIIDIAEEQFKIDIRKKSGTKRLKK